MSAENEAKIDLPRILELARLVGSKRLAELFNILDARFREVMVWLADNQLNEEFIRLVHQSQGSAASLGLIRVAASLKQIEKIIVDEDYQNSLKGTESMFCSIAKKRLQALFSDFQEDKLCALNGLTSAAGDTACSPSSGCR